MKLQVKITAISLAVTIAVLAAGLLAFNIVQEAALKRADEANARKALSLFCTNVTSVVNTDTSQIQTVTLRSIVTYYFSTYAHLLDGGGTAYALTENGRYLFSNSPVDLLAAVGSADAPLLTLVSDGRAVIPIQGHVTAEGTFLLGTCSFQISSQVFLAYICTDVSGTGVRIAQMRWISAAILLLAFLCVAVLTAFLLRPVLKPVDQLTQTAVRIAGGEFNRRTGLRSKDEIGQLSVAFDRMADSVEEKIMSLDEQLQKKQFLLGALTHELKTPMTAIIGYADSLLHAPLSEEQRITCAQKIYAAGRHTEALSQKLMELISLSEESLIKKRRFPACRLAEALRETAAAGIRLSCEPFDLYGDETLLLSMIRNLIDNAVRASSEGAPIDVAICGNEQQARITVSDQGCGIPPECISLVTEPFFRVDQARSRKSGGVGLGLALCKLIAEYHGGGIHIASELGKGTRVTVIFSQIDHISETT